MIKAVIIDDEIKARTLLRSMLEAYCKDIEVVADCRDLPHGVKAIRKLKPELVFLDIEMPGHSGMEILDFFDEHEIDFSIIFVTAYNTYAIKAFRLSAVDYLLKPIEPAELEEAVERFKKKQHRSKTDITVLKENIREGKLNRLAVPDANVIKFIQLDEVLYFKADSSYTEIVFIDEKKLIISRTLKNIEETLNGQSGFFRCHKSYLVNTKHITGYTKSEGGYLIVKDKLHIPVSSDKIDELVTLTPFVKRK